MPGMALASFALARGRNKALNPLRAAASAMLSAPLTGRNRPSSASSPRNILSPSAKRGTCRVAIRYPMAMARSYCEPVFFTSAGARFTVILRFSRFGGLAPEFFKAELTRSLASFSALSARPTMVNACKPTFRSTSTSMTCA